MILMEKNHFKGNIPLEGLVMDLRKVYRKHKSIARHISARPSGLGKMGNHVAQCLEVTAETVLLQKATYEEVICKIPSTSRSTFLMVFSTDGSRVASTHGDHNVYVSDVKSGRCVATLRGHPRTPWCVAFHPSSNGILASGCLGGEVRVWDLHGGSEVWAADNRTVIASLAFHPSDRVLVIATYNELHFWDWGEPKPFAKCSTANDKEKVRFITFDSLGMKLITGIANRSMIPSQWDQMERSIPDPAGNFSYFASGSWREGRDLRDNRDSRESRETSRHSSTDSTTNPLRPRFETFLSHFQRFVNTNQSTSGGVDRGTDPMSPEQEGRTDLSYIRERLQNLRRQSNMRTYSSEDGSFIDRRIRREAPVALNLSTSSSRSQSEDTPVPTSQSDCPQVAVIVSAVIPCSAPGETPSASIQPSTRVPDRAARTPLRLTQSCINPSQSATSSSNEPHSDTSTRSATSSAIRASNQQVSQGLCLLSGHVEHMRRICRDPSMHLQRRQVLQLQQIRGILDDLQHQIRSLHASLRADLRNSPPGPPCVGLGRTSTDGWSNESPTTAFSNTHRFCRISNAASLAQHPTNPTSHLIPTPSNHPAPSTSRRSEESGEAEGPVARVRRRLRTLSTPSAMAHTFSATHSRRRRLLFLERLDYHSRYANYLGRSAHRNNPSASDIRNNAGIGSTTDSGSARTTAPSTTRAVAVSCGGTDLSTRGIHFNPFLSSIRATGFANGNSIPVDPNASNGQGSSESSRSQSGNNGSFEPSNGNVPNIQGPSGENSATRTSTEHEGCSFHRVGDHPTTMGRVNRYGRHGYKRLAMEHERRKKQTLPSTSSSSDRGPDGQPLKKRRLWTASSAGVMVPDESSDTSSSSNSGGNSVEDSPTVPPTTTSQTTGLGTQPSTMQSLLERLERLIREQRTRSTRSPFSNPENETTSELSRDDMDVNRPGSDIYTPLPPLLRSMGSHRFRTRTSTPYGSDSDSNDGSSSHTWNCNCWHTGRPSVRDTYMRRRALALRRVQRESRDFERRAHYRHILSTMVDSLTSFFQQHGIVVDGSPPNVDDQMHSLFLFLRVALHLASIILSELQSIREAPEERTISRLPNPFSGSVTNDTDDGELNLLNPRHRNNQDIWTIPPVPVHRRIFFNSGRVQQDNFPSPPLSPTAIDNFQRPFPVNFQVTVPVTINSDDPIPIIPIYPRPSQQDDYFDVFPREVDTEVEELNSPPPLPIDLDADRSMPIVIQPREPALVSPAPSASHRHLYNALEQLERALSDTASATQEVYAHLQNIRSQTENIARESGRYGSQSESGRYGSQTESGSNRSTLPLLPEVLVNGMSVPERESVTSTTSSSNPPSARASRTIHSMMWRRLESANPPTIAVQGEPRGFRILNPARNAENRNSTYLHPLDARISRTGSRIVTSSARPPWNYGRSSQQGSFLHEHVVLSNSCVSLTHRIQMWDFIHGDIPDISDAEKNMVVKECKIHNDASVSVSPDGLRLVTLLPGRFNGTTMLGIYSLAKESLGTCIYTWSFEQNAVSVSLSPTGTHLLVGLASRRSAMLPHDQQTIAQVFRLDPPPVPLSAATKGRLRYLKDIEQNGEHNYVSLNCIRWAPIPGQGMVYGTNMGTLKVLR